MLSSTTIQQPPSSRALTDRYADMLHALEVARQGDEAGNSLEARIYALVAVACFLDGDPKVHLVSRPFLKVANAMHDVSQGARPPLFTPSTKSKGGRPTGLSIHAARAVEVHALDLLMSVPKHERPTRRDAGRIMAIELRNAGIDDFGRKITANRALNWRDEIGAKAPAFTNEMHKRLTEYQTEEARN